MSAILRNNAAVVHRDIINVDLRGEGSGGVPLAEIEAKKVSPRYNHAKDPAAELMPAAEFLGFEPDFQAVLEDFEGSPFDPSRRKILGSLMGVFAMDYQGARSEERRFLRRLLACRNAREGYAANRALHLALAPNVIRRTLALGVAESRRETGPIDGFLGAVQARVAATTLRMLGPEGKETIWNLLTLAGTDERKRPRAGADRMLERALILKALAARRQRLGPWSKDGRAALFELETFAAGIRGASRALLAACTTLHDIDPKRVPKARPSDVCELAVYRAKGDIDPALAWREHGSPKVVATSTPLPEGADEALPDLDRSPLLERARLHQALAEARVHGEALLPKPLADALTDYVLGKELFPQRLAKKDEALTVLAKRGFDVIRAASVEAIREDARAAHSFDAARALGDLLSRFSGATYLRRVFSDQQTASADPLGQIRHALAQGFAVPFVVTELKLPLSRAFLALTFEEETASLDIREAARAEPIVITQNTLLEPILPERLGRRTRADAFFAPAALDLIAPPFGLPFETLGVVDRL